MPNRVMYEGDTYPNVLLSVSDETGVLNLSTATSIDVQFIGKSYTFSASGTAIWPAEADPGGGSTTWNLSVTLSTGDTANADTFQIFVVVTWTTGNVETFPCDSTLQVLALPVS